MTSPTHQNRLAAESSPYLRQHAGNPVEWYPWGDEAFKRAVAEDKPIFLSVGYSSCHWCHVMAHESFEDMQVAEILNRDFIPVKVDREEHPDIDALYMTATQLITQRGGWPNSVWLTPDLKPWYAGTYFPREDRQGRIGFISLLQRLTALWKERRREVDEQADALTAAIRQNHAMKPEGNPGVQSDARQLSSRVQAHYLNQYDPRYGGFGDAPKFPPHSGLLLLLRTLELSPSRETSQIITSTLDAMLRGGIYDQVGGGFHRYATDEKWLLPHFEKMLYDNALLLKCYAIAASVYRDDKYRRVVMETAAWLSREMIHPEGGVYSALDADSEGEEGKYYTWSSDELSRVLDSDTLKHFSDLYQIRPHGNFDDEATGRSTGLNIPHLRATATELEIQQLLDARTALLNHRNTRVHPGLDNKIITAWNGLFISALAVAGKYLNHPPFIEMAIKARTFIDRYLTDGARLARCWCGHPSPNEGALDDYAAIALADLDLYEATGQMDYMQRAGDRIAYILSQFYDESTGEIFMTSRHHASPLFRLRDVYDQGSPSGSGLAIQAMMRMGVLKSDRSMIDTARRIAASYERIIQHSPSAAATLIQGLLSVGSLSWPDSINNSITVAITPDILTFDHRGRAECTLAVSLPDGWHLNEIFTNSAGQKCPIELNVETPGYSIVNDPAELDSHSWKLTLTCAESAGLPPRALAIQLRYQPCSDSECLAIQQVNVSKLVEQST